MELWRQGFKAKGSLLGWLHSLVNWCDDCWDRGRLVPLRNGKLLTGGGSWSKNLGIKTELIRTDK